MNRAERRRQQKAARKIGKAMAPPYRDAEGLTNEDALAVIAESLGGPPERGAVYRIGFRQGAEGRQVQFIGEYLGLGRDRFEAVAVADELAMAFVIRNPVLPEGMQGASADNPVILWPLDIWHFSPSQPGDLDTVMHYKREGEDIGRAPGRPPLQ